MTDDAWVKGVAMLSVLPDREMTRGERKARGKVYRRKLGHLTDEQWMRAVNACLEQETFFPAIAIVLKYGAPQVTEAEVLIAFDRVIACRGYHPNVGGIWDLKRIRSEIGEAAAQGFAAAGGQAAFQVMLDRDRPYTFKAFSAAYRAALRVNPGFALPEAPVKRLGA